MIALMVQGRRRGRYDPLLGADYTALELDRKGVISQTGKADAVITQGCLSIFLRDVSCNCLNLRSTCDMIESGQKPDRVVSDCQWTTYLLLCT